MIKQKKQQIIKNYQNKANDTGSPEVQLGILNEQIKNFTLHLNKNPKDLHSKRGFLIMIAKKKKILNYLKKINQERYNKIIVKLEK